MMKLSAWLSLATLLMLSLALGMFSQNASNKIKSLGPCGLEHSLKPSPWLCGEKIKLVDARAADFASLPGISAKTARLIFSYILAHKDVSIADLIAIKGVGPKTLLKLGEYFH